MHSHIGRAAVPDDFPEADMTPFFPYYAADDEEGITGNPDEVGNIKIPTPWGQRQLRGRITGAVN